MVSVAIATRPVVALQMLLRLVQSRVLQLALAIQRAKQGTALPRIAMAGAAWVALAHALGGFYVRPWQLPGVALRVAYTVAVTLSEYAARGFKPLFDEWTLSFEIVRAVTRCVMANYGDRMVVAACAQHIRRQSEVAGTALGWIATWRLGLVTRSFVHNGLEHVWVHSDPDAHAIEAPDTPPRRRHRVVVLYFHGGGYTLLSPRMYIHFASELEHRVRDRLRDKLGPDELVDVDILLANYRKIPEHPYPVPVLDAVEMYKFLLNDERLAPSHIIVAGDSAGGGLTMATLLRVRDENPALLPAAAILSCPFVDFEVGGDERKAPYCIIADRAGKAIYNLYHPRGSESGDWGDASPVHCELHGLPPVYIQAAELDYILPHAKRLYAKAKADGATDWDLEIFANVPHVFSFFPTAVLPSAARGVDAMAEYAATKFAHALEQAPNA